MVRRYAILEIKKANRSYRSGPRVAGAKSLDGEIKVHDAELSEKELREARRNPAVRDVSLIMPVRLIAPVEKAPLAAGNAPASSWGIRAIGADRTDLDGSNVVVAVLDTGIDRKQPAFAGVDIVEEDFGGSGNGDVDGHGTHCAGTIFGKDVDGVRIGIARNIKQALIGKVFKDGGGGDSLAVYRAMQWAADKGANVISMSLGYDFPGMVRELEEDGYPVALATSIALEHFKDNLRMFDSVMNVLEAGRAFGRGPIVVAASGNESERDRDPRFRISASLPSSAKGVISVAAVRENGAGFEIANFSNGRAKVCAPGQDIVSAALKNGLALMSGTSMACPHVAGLAALWWQGLVRSGALANAEKVTQRMLSATTIENMAGLDPEDVENGFTVAPS
ncbi:MULTISPECIES: S8 family serine peptidase [Agrobacterium]|uniref:Peptidase S8 n=2 Tax=Agrobacterium tumefaciens complex TaxID=1183400 RepID=A0AAE6BHV5_AGRTU|nr:MULTISPECIES: S8 family serine peptidase [Agrobacterium]QCL77485.1 peptidase S8 [Agrobacterium tumefaciens]QCL82973.1 peptidase S8 [Agrobacterium tumefaciens]CUX71652.1 Peptidase S8 and S53 subtilisin kexin sedolisin [Agrobacterium sp. NCPPB 925]